jgi:hypothetical protein
MEIFKSSKNTNMINFQNYTIKTNYYSGSSEHFNLSNFQNIMDELISKENDIESFEIKVTNLNNKNYKNNINMTKEEIEKNNKKEIEKNNKKEIEKNNNKEIEKNNNKEIEKNNNKEIEKNNNKEIEKNNNKEIELENDEYITVEEYQKIIDDNFGIDPYLIIDDDMIQLLDDNRRYNIISNMLINNNKKIIDEIIKNTIMNMNTKIDIMDLFVELHYIFESKGKKYLLDFIEEYVLPGLKSNYNFKQIEKSISDNPYRIYNKK